MFSMLLMLFFRVDAQNIETVGDSIEISLKDYTPNQIQWQFSNNKQNWTDIKGATSEKLNYKITESGYFRAKVDKGCAFFSDTTSIFATTVRNVDTLSNVTYIYYKDSLSVSNALHTTNSGNYSINNTDFRIDKDKLFLKNPNNITKVNYDLIISDRNSSATYPLKIKIRCWIRNKYALTPVLKDNVPQFIYTQQDTTYTIENGKLYYSIKTQGAKIFCSDFQLADPMYNQMIHKYGYYAFRTGTKIYISSDLKKWDLIYDDKRGIKESMVLVKNKNGCELLFTEYSPGTILCRHYLRIYNLKSKESSIRMSFYTPDDFKSQGLSPQARHIHFLVQDPYLGIIFIGTGDLDNQSSVYFSNDQGLSFLKLGGGSQKWRSLSMFFNTEYIFWNMDASSTQYLCRVKKADLTENMSESKLSQFPIINSALWCSTSIAVDDKQNQMIVMSSNNEGALYDNNFRNYGIMVENNEPLFYELLVKNAKNLYSQFYPIGTDANNNILFLDLDTMKPAFYKVELIPKM